MTTSDPTVVMVRARIQAPHLYEPFTNKFGKTQYSVILRLYDEKEFAKVEAAKLAACERKFGAANAEKKLRVINKNPNCCLLREPDEEEGYRFMTVTRKPDDGMPTLLDRTRKNVSQADGLFVSGAWVNALIQTWAYDNQSTGVGATIVGLQFVKADEPFGGAPKAKAEDFEDLGDDGEEGDNPLFA